MNRWRTVPLGTAVEFAYGKALPRAARSEHGTVPVYGSNGIAGWHDEALVQGPTVIVGRKGSAGAVQYVDQPCYPIDTTYFVRPRSGFEFDMRFLFYLLRRIDLSRLRTATGVPGLTREDAYREVIPVPSINEQRRIVDLLSRAEGIVRLRREAQAKAQAIIPALFLDMFGDPATNPKGWETKQIGDLSTLVTSGSTPRGGSEVYVEDGPYFIRSQNVLMNRLVLETAARIPLAVHEEMARTKVSPGDVLLNITGASIGRVTWVQSLPQEANVNQHVCIIRVKRQIAEPSFLSVWLSLPYQQATINMVQAGASRQALNHEQVRALRVLCPPVDLQRRFDARLTSVAAITAQQEMATSKAAAAFDAMLAKVFSTGDLRRMEEAVEAIYG